ncbi:MAG: hypothetical protein JZU65_17095 [Chlorobium sp.]|nr:hypothetical protein [Chlorobium sp.]
MTAKKLPELVSKAWTAVIEKIESGHPLSSEKTLCFLFLWEFSKLLENPEKLEFDFEYQAYSDLPGESTFLDLLIYTDEKCKVAIEFKLPHKTRAGGSDKTENRKKIYRDLARLNYLVNNQVNNIQLGIFLCATDEAPYFNLGKYKKYANLITHDGFSSQPSFETIDGLTLEFSAPFTWDGICGDLPKKKIVGHYAWLRPLCFSKRDNLVKIESLCFRSLYE